MPLALSASPTFFLGVCGGRIENLAGVYLIIPNRLVPHIARAILLAKAMHRLTKTRGCGH